MQQARIVEFAGGVGDGGAMRVRDRDTLARFMAANAVSQAELARVAGVSRQFIHMMVRGEKRSCRPDVAARIEQGLRVLPGTIFVWSALPSEPAEGTSGRVGRGSGLG